MAAVCASKLSAGTLCAHVFVGGVGGGLSARDLPFALPFHHLPHLGILMWIFKSGRYEKYFIVCSLDLHVAAELC